MTGLTIESLRRAARVLEENKAVPEGYVRVSLAVILDDPLGKEEGDVCGLDGCDGIIELPPVQGCTCFRSPPCGACMDNKLACNKCWREIE